MRRQRPQMRHALEDSMPAASISQPNSNCQAATASVAARIFAHFR